ncbi:MAG: LysR family transcriptional regulator, partial [Burkholderiaceae bacterium]|nr:LysR family transcriptional regulator [Burkholderiaceae bacterium]
PQLLGEFMRRHPAVTLSLHVDNRLIDMVEEGVDLAIRVGRIGDANLIVRKLQTVPFVVAASPGYWSARGRPRQPDELASHDALTFSVLGLQPQWQFVIDNQLLAVPVNSRADASDAAPLIDLARQGLGMVWMPRLLLAPHLENGSLQAVLEEFTVRDIWLYAAYAQRRHNSAAMRAMLSLLESHWKQG